MNQVRNKYVIVIVTYLCLTNTALEPCMNLELGPIAPKKAQSFAASPKSRRMAGGGGPPSVS